MSLSKEAIVSIENVLRMLGFKPLLVGATARDLTDIKYLIENYELIEPESYMDVLENHEYIFSQFGFEADSSSAITIGTKILKIAQPKTKERLISILDSNSNINKMIVIMAPGIDIDGEDQTREQKRCRLYLNSLLTALKDK